MESELLHLEVPKDLGTVNNAKDKGEIETDIENNDDSVNELDDKIKDKDIKAVIDEAEPVAEAKSKLEIAPESKEGPQLSLT